jgi:hypothetical protein
VVIVVVFSIPGFSLLFISTTKRCEEPTPSAVSVLLSGQVVDLVTPVGLGTPGERVWVQRKQWLKCLLVSALQIFCQLLTLLRRT